MGRKQIIKFPRHSRKLCRRVGLNTGRNREKVETERKRESRLEVCTTDVNFGRVQQYGFKKNTQYEKQYETSNFSVHSKAIYTKNADLIKLNLR